MRHFQRLIDATARITGAVLSLFLILAGPGLAQESVDPVPLVVETENGQKSFFVEVADTDAERAIGLMNRESMPADHGMLFDFMGSRDVYMWMKNTPLSLDMVFIRADGTIAGIAENTIPFSEAIIASPGPVAYVLELNAGTAASKGLAIGDNVVHPAIKP